MSVIEDDPKLQRLMDVILDRLDVKGKLTHGSSGSPVIVGVAGGVSVGKSTVCKKIEDILKDQGYKTTIVGCDSFLMSNAMLQERDLMNRKGFPESFLDEEIQLFLTSVKSLDLSNTPTKTEEIENSPKSLSVSGVEVIFHDALVRQGSVKSIRIPIYDHTTYDIKPDEKREICPHDLDIILFEGINVLNYEKDLDLKIYIDATEEDMKQWYLKRWYGLKAEIKANPSEFFKPFLTMNEEAFQQLLDDCWININIPNLHHFILPTKEKADIVVKKGANHLIEEIYLSEEILFNSK
jgi:type I pantothenate kinase